MSKNLAVRSHVPLLPHAARDLRGLQGHAEEQASTGGEAGQCGPVQWVVLLLQHSCVWDCYSWYVAALGYILACLDLTECAFVAEGKDKLALLEVG